MGKWAQREKYESPRAFRQRLKIRGGLMMAKTTRPSRKESVFLESRLAYHLRCLREDATDMVPRERRRATQRQKACTPHLRRRQLSREAVGTRPALRIRSG